MGRLFETAYTSEIITSPHNIIAAIPDNTIEARAFLLDFKKNIIHATSAGPPRSYTKLERLIAGRIVREAALLLEEKGWTKGRYSLGVMMCAAGAINKVVGVSPSPSIRSEIARSVFASWLGVPKVEMWNDKHDNGEEVIRWMHKFADEMDPQST